MPQNKKSDQKFIIDNGLKNKNKETKSQPKKTKSEDDEDF